ncbi:RNA polymerase subunit sigma-24 [Marinomonas piezotolerans]|uniref:RNA polymerase subunit sigma-24 n=1 Tax=Marinomonas piezotolerans TaxID=2213058 RepID=A0A370U6X5_9GAMM|nr:sigma-70 family RNA polymerase sigma factor [Marinomonas piezotolerans]RDL43528.1 RNA polymerase subunit sigma-24 [Marinomonas piezotolerans]
MDNLEWNRQVNALLYRIQNRDQLALRLLYELCSGKVLGLISRIVNEQHEAEDVLQDVFIKIWNQAEQHNNQGAAWAWICVMSRNSSLDRLRKLQKHPHISTDENDELINALIYNDDGPDNIALNRCLYALKEQTRSSVLQSYLYGYSHNELAQKMSVPLGTMKAWIRRGLQELKLCLEA